MKKLQFFHLIEKTQIFLYAFINFESYYIFWKLKVNINYAKMPKTNTNMPMTRCLKAQPHVGGNRTTYHGERHFSRTNSIGSTRAHITFFITSNTVCSTNGKGFMRREITHHMTTRQTSNEKCKQISKLTRSSFASLTMNNKNNRELR